MTDQEKEQVREKARELYARGSDYNIEIDDDAEVSEGDEFHWVQAWLAVPVDVAPKKGEGDGKVRDV